MSQEDQSEEIERKIGGLTVCPRCGQFGWAYVRSDGYVYVLHKEKRHGKTKTRHCYLGPVDTYKHTYVTNEIMLRGLIDPYRYIRYLDMILDKIAELRVENSEERKRIAQQLERIVKKIEEIRKTLEA